MLDLAKIEAGRLELDEQPFALPVLLRNLAALFRQRSEDKGLHHGSKAQPPAVATRVFAWGLQHASSPGQWRRWRPIVERNCPRALWCELVEGFDLDAEGRIA